MKHMQKPKLLPWLARQAGISDDCAEMLWNKAVALAGPKRRQATEGHYMAEAMQQMLALLEREKTAALPGRAQAGRYPAHFSRFGLRGFACAT